MCTTLSREILLKFQMAQNSLFAILLRSPWWVSIVIGLALAVASFALLPSHLRVVGALSGAPFVVIGFIAAATEIRRGSPGPRAGC